MPIDTEVQTAGDITAEKAANEAALQAEMLSALDDSIAHWGRLSNGTRRADEYAGSGDCALCDLFYAANCFRCPVAKKTATTHCRRTPYNAAREAVVHYGIDSDEFKAAAVPMLQFLQNSKNELIGHTK
jgi:hypothetical protein